MGSTEADMRRNQARRTGWRGRGLAGALVGVLLGMLMLAGEARAQQAGAVVERAAQALASDPVYVDPAAQTTLDAAAAERLRAKVESSDAGAVYIAVLPPEAKTQAGGSTDAVLGQLVQATRRQGTYVVVVGTELRAGSTSGTPFARGTVPSLATAAVEAHRGERAEAVLTDLVDRLSQAASGASQTGDS